MLNMEKQTFVRNTLDKIICSIILRNRTQVPIKVERMTKMFRGISKTDLFYLIAFILTIILLYISLITA